MAKKSTDKTGSKASGIENNIIPQDITDTLETNFMPYVMSVIISRAIPEIDGFKPAHRKLLYTMYKMGLLNGSRRKSADVVGQTMQLNPHGDGPIYETMVRLTRGNDALLHPFIDSKGNFGKQYSRDMAYAASRYTEVKLDGICTELFANIDRDTVDFIDNYNGRLKEPVLFPTTFPNLLVTPNQGIAVGMASSICSFNLKEVCNATMAYIRNPDCDLTKHLTAPDFSTGGELIYSQKDMDNIYSTGRGSFRVRAKYRYDKKNSLIEVYEIPYSTTIEAIIDKIVTLVKSGKIKEITDVRDETDLNGLKITIDIRRSSNPEHVMHRLFNMTSLSDSFSCNFNLLIDGKPRIMGIKDILEEWLIFRINCISRQTKYDIGKKQDRLHLLDGLAKILLDIDKAISIIRNTEEDKLVIPNLMAGFSIDELQAEFIAEIRLRNLNKEYILKQVNERENLIKEIAELKEILDSRDRISEIIIRELKEVSRKYGKPRRTTIVQEQEVPEISDDVFIEDYGIKIFLTSHSYFKKIPLTSLRASAEQYVKDDDKIIQEIETTNRAEIIFLSNKYNAYKAKAYELPDCKASSLGDYLANLLKMDEDEQIIFMAATTDYSGDLLFAYENGKFSKVSLMSYSTKMNRRKLINAYSDKSPLVFAAYLAEEQDFLAMRDSDKATLFSSAVLESKTAKNTAGIQVYTLKKNSKVSRVYRNGEFICDDVEYYRTNKIPSTGHFIPEKDKNANGLV